MGMTAPVRAVGLCYEVDGVTLVDRVSLEARAGEVFAVVGPNGAGKSTLLDLLAGELTPSSGTVELMGLDPARARPIDLARIRAVLPQQTVIRFAFRALDIVLMGRFALEGDEDDVTASRRAMATTDSLDLEARIFPTLSGGEQTRVHLARVLAQETPILFLDEPTGSLDLRHQELAMATLRGLAGAGASVVVVVHDLNLAARHADRVALMSRGRLAAVGSTGEVLTAATVEEVYGHPVAVIDHPASGAPIILPR
jgi:iron complex transport system ATP-binding protein